MLELFFCPPSVSAIDGRFGLLRHPFQCLCRSDDFDAPENQRGQGRIYFGTSTKQCDPGPFDYVAERLNRAIIEKDIERDNQFYEETRLPRAERATLDDYKGSGFDRGHMAPAADMGTDEAMAQSFSLANIVPQAPINNRKTWAKIEKDTRKYVMRAAGDVYVITGTVYEANPATIGAGKVWVPQHMSKLVYDPSSRRAWVHWLDNTDEARVGKPISYEELVQRTWIDFLPGFALP